MLLSIFAQHLCSQPNDVARCVILLLTSTHAVGWETWIQTERVYDIERSDYDPLKIMRDWSKPSGLRYGGPYKILITYFGKIDEGYYAAVNFPKNLNYGENPISYWQSVVFAEGRNYNCTQYPSRPDRP